MKLASLQTLSSSKLARERDNFCNEQQHAWASYPLAGMHVPIRKDNS